MSTTTRPGGTWQNWARTEKVRPQLVEYPNTIEAVRRSVRSAAGRGRPVKAVGSGHSFTGIAVAPKELIFLPRAEVAKRTDLRRWQVVERGGHFLPAEQPAILAAEYRAYFADVLG